MDCFKGSVASIFGELIEKVGFQNICGSYTSYTILAPVDQAFSDDFKEKLLKEENRGNFIALMQYHVVVGRFIQEGNESDTLLPGHKVKALNDNGNVKVFGGIQGNSASIISSIRTPTGFDVHFVSHVLLPAGFAFVPDVDLRSMCVHYGQPNDFQGSRPYAPLPPPPPPIDLLSNPNPQPNPAPAPPRARRRCCQCPCTPINCPSANCDHLNQCQGRTMEGSFCVMNRKSTNPHDKQLRVSLGRRAGLAPDGKHLTEVLVLKGKYKGTDLPRIIMETVVEKMGVTLQLCTSPNCSHTSLCVKSWIPPKQTLDFPVDELGMAIANTLVEEGVFKVWFKSDMTICGCHFTEDEVVVTGPKSFKVKHGLRFMGAYP
eukprot:m.21832 g.21832  ORF g.21832 m.21832 type:complete len:374 (+) comp7239_c0_seq1:426-1547(+)